MYMYIYVSKCTYVYVDICKFCMRLWLRHPLLPSGSLQMSHGFSMLSLRTTVGASA